MQVHNDESIFIDFTYQEGSIPDGYGSSFKVVMGDETLLSGQLEKSDSGDAFLLRITSENIQNLSIGEYMLYVTVENESIGYKDYIYEEVLKVV